MTGQVKPVSASDRIPGLDILRGIALLGILVVNALGFNASFFDFGGFYSGLPDAFQSRFYTVFISLTADKFIFLFSFLFGYGIFMQFRKFMERDRPFSVFLTRRMLVLSLFGIIHVFFLWAGDILLLYSVSGIFLLLLHKLPTVWQAFLAVFFYFFIGIWLTASVWIPLPDALSSTCTGCLDQAKMVYANGNYLQCLGLRLQEYMAFRYINLLYYLPKVTGIMLFGFIASRYNLHQQVQTNKTAWILIFAGTAIVGTVSCFSFEKLVDFQSRFATAAYMTGYEFMNFFMATSYLLFILIAASFTSVAKALKPVAWMGQMSLTNYMMQSLILSVIFYGWGFGMFGSVRVTGVVLTGIFVYIFQMILSAIWFRYYHQGPLEKLWRRLSYGTPTF